MFSECSEKPVSYTHSLPHSCSPLLFFLAVQCASEFSSLLGLLSTALPRCYDGLFRFQSESHHGISPADSSAATVAQAYQVRDLARHFLGQRRGDRSPGTRCPSSRPTLPARSSTRSTFRAVSPRDGCVSKRKSRQLSRQRHEFVPGEPRFAPGNEHEIDRFSASQLVGVLSSGPKKSPAPRRRARQGSVFRIRDRP